MTLLLPLAMLWFAAVAFAPLDGRRRLVGWLAVAALAASLAATIRLAVDVFRGGSPSMVAGGWPPGVGIALRADALGVAFALVSTSVLLVALAYEVIGGVHGRALPSLVLFMGTGLTGLFLTADVFNFYVFFEIAMTSAFVLASYGPGTRQVRAAVTFTVVNLLGSVFFLAGIAALYHVSGTLDMQGASERLEAADQSAVLLIAVLLFVAFAIKLGLFPFHIWVPPVYRDTWPSIAAILSGALANIGSYGLLRFGPNLMPRETQTAEAGFLFIGGVSILYGAVQAVSTRSLREVLAYSAIGQGGYVLVALAMGGPLAYAAAILYALLNSINKLVLFLASGVQGWLVGAAFAIGAFSVAGVPPAAGFFGKVAVLRAGVESGSVSLVILVFLGAALSFVYMFQGYQRAYWRAEPVAEPSPVAARLVVFGVAGLIIALGVWPEPLLAMTERAAATISGPRP